MWKNEKESEKKNRKGDCGGGVGGVPVVTSPWGCWILLEGSTAFLGLHLILAFMHPSREKDYHISKSIGFR